MSDRRIQVMRIWPKRIFCWRDQFHPSRECCCSLRLFDQRQYNEPPVFIASERPDNPGPSITNSAECLWPQVLKYYSVNHDATRPWAVLIEHYPPAPNIKHSTPLGDFDLVELTRSSAPLFKPEGCNFEVAWSPLRDFERWRRRQILDVAAELNFSDDRGPTNLAKWLNEHHVPEVSHD